MANNDDLNRAAQFLPFDAMKGLTEALQERIDRRMKIERIELTDEQLSAVNGGGCNSATKPDCCPRCGSTNIRCESMKHTYTFTDYYYACKCRDCSYKWEVE